MLPVHSFRSALVHAKPLYVGTCRSTKTRVCASSSAGVRPLFVRKSQYHSSMTCGSISYVDRRPAGGQFHVTDEKDDFESDLALDVDESEKVSVSSGEDAFGDKKSIRFSRHGAVYEYVGENEFGEKVFRPEGLGASVPTKLVRKVRLRGKRRSMKQFESVLVQEVMKDEDFDRFSAPEPLSPLDFSRLFSASSDLNSLFDATATATGLRFIKHRDALVQAFESCVKSASRHLIPMDVSSHAIGKEMLEMHVLNALSSTYPHLPPNALIKVTQDSSSPTALARALLSLKLEPYIQLVPSMPLSKFADPSEACLQLAANAYLSLLGVIYLEHGFEASSKVLFNSLHLAKITPEELKKLHLLDVEDSKATLYRLLRKLRFPLPVYEIESAKKEDKVQNVGQGNRYTAIVKSGHKIIGRGVSNSKARAEARAAMDALLLHWSMQTPL